MTPKRYPIVATTANNPAKNGSTRGSTKACRKAVTASAVHASAPTPYAVAAPIGGSARAAAAISAENAIVVAATPISPSSASASC
jgi:hypothetical protein